jgi:hypothetical protein
MTGRIQWGVIRHTGQVRQHESISPVLHVWVEKRGMLIIYDQLIRYSLLFLSLTFFFLLFL